MIYQYGRSNIELLSKYLYEIDVYYISYDRAELLQSKFVSSNKELKIKHEISIENHKRKDKGYIIQKSITLLGAPQSFMDKYGLKPIE